LFTEKLASVYFCFCNSWIKLQYWVCPWYRGFSSEVLVHLWYILLGPILTKCFWTDENTKEKKWKMTISFLIWYWTTKLFCKNKMWPLKSPQLLNNKNKLVSKFQYAIIMARTEIFWYAIFFWQTSSHLSRIACFPFSWMLRYS
jgi:hypothetical protein